MTLIDAGLNAEAPFKTVTIPRCEPLNERLRDVLLSMSGSIPDEGSHRPSGRSFFASKWLSTNQLHRDEGPAFRTLAAAIEDAANSLPQRIGCSPPLHIFSMWCIVSRAGMEGARHNHKGAISAAYYVDAGMSGEGAGGQLHFYADGKQSAPTHAVTPRAGLLVLFPSSLLHSVSRYLSDKPRIVISANLS